MALTGSAGVSSTLPLVEVNRRWYGNNEVF